MSNIPCINKINHTYRVTFGYKATPSFTALCPTKITAAPPKATLPAIPCRAKTPNHLRFHCMDMNPERSQCPLLFSFSLKINI